MKLNVTFILFEKPSRTINEVEFGPPTLWFVGMCSNSLSYRIRLHIHAILFVINYSIEIKFGIGIVHDLYN